MSPIVGIDPEILVVVAAGRAAKSRPRLAAVGGTHGDCADHNHYVGIFRVNLWDGKIAAADAAGGTRIIRDLRPRIASIVGTVDAQFARGCGESRVQAPRIAGRDGHINLRKILGQAVSKSVPGAAAVGGFKQAPAPAIEFVAIFPRDLPELPTSRRKPRRDSRDQSPRQSCRCFRP